MWANTCLHLLGWTVTCCLYSHLPSTQQSSTKLLSSVHNFHLLLANCCSPGKVKHCFAITNVHLIHTKSTVLPYFLTVIPLPQREFRISATSIHIVLTIPETLLGVISLCASELVFRTPKELLKWNSDYFIIGEK